MIKTEHLQVLDFIVQYGSFKAAADALHISQPSVSVAIKSLEDSLGILLFDRSQYRPQLTEKGMAFYQKAKVSLENLKSLDLFAKELLEDEFLEVHIAVDAIMIYEPILEKIYDLILKKSNAYLYFNTEVLSGGYDRVINDEVDFAIGPWLADFPINSEIEKIKIQTIKMIPVVHKKVWRSQDLNDLIKIPQVIAKDSGSKKYSLSYGILDCSHKIIVNEPSLKERLILGGYGWGRVAEPVVSATKDLIRIPEDLANSFEIDIYLIRRRARPMNKDIKAIWDSLL
ncbi:MAG: LysR family transcriptional regulator [Bdellovibrionales bacterium]|nr:LysR family transcriptional regulator [Bdellovibrionales bacterium]